MASIRIRNSADLSAILKDHRVDLTGDPPKIRPHKYRAVPTVYNGIRYDSRSEATYAALLDSKVAAGSVLWWVRAPTFHLGCPENTYRPDFLVVTREGVYLVDVKGRETAKFRRDKKLWAAYGPAPLKIVKLALYPNTTQIRHMQTEVIEGN